MSDHHFVFLPIAEASKISSKHYYPIKKCRRGHTSGRRVSHKYCIECVKIKSREYDASHREKAVLKNLKGRCAKSGVKFDLDIEDLPEIPDRCPILGIRLERHCKRGIFDSSISLDKIIPELGYVRGNVAWVSGRANRLKSDASICEVRKILKYMERHDQLTAAKSSDT